VGGPNFVGKETRNLCAMDEKEVNQTEQINVLILEGI
jgi:hypothetical protein